MPIPDRIRAAHPRTAGALRLPDGNRRTGNSPSHPLTIRSARPGDLLTYAYDVTPERIVGLTRDSFAWNGTSATTSWPKFRRARRRAMSAPCFSNC